MSRLALLGGPPAIAQPPPHFTWPPIDERTEQAVLRQLRTSISIYDRSGVIAELEDALCAYHGVRHALLTSSGTAALYSMYAGAGIQPGDEVIAPAYTFFATVTPLLHLGAIPVLVDCDHTGNMDPLAAAQRITPKTRAIVVTHMWGLPANMAPFRELANKHGLLLFEDGSHAHGARLNGQLVGTFGDAAAFSMNGPKTLSAGEGGFILTNRDDIFHGALMHGQYNKRCRNEIPSDSPLHPFAVTGMGLKHRIHPLAAAIGLEQLRRLDEYLDGRQQIAAQLCEQLGEVRGIEVPVLIPGSRPSWYGLSLRYRAEELGGLSIDRFHQALTAEGCHELDRPRSTCPLNLHPALQMPESLWPSMAGQFIYRPRDFPLAEALHGELLRLTVWHRASDFSLASRYVAAFQKAVQRHPELLGDEDDR